MYKKDKAKAAAVYTCGMIAAGVCIALIAFFVYTLSLRTEYRKVCLEINDHILTSPASSNFVLKGGMTYPLSDQILEYYNMALLGDNTVVFNRKECEPTAKSIVLVISECTLTFTGLEDGSAVNVRWDTPEDSRSYTLRSSSVSFMQMSAYMNNYLRRTEPIAP